MDSRITSSRAFLRQFVLRVIIHSLNNSNRKVMWIGDPDKSKIDTIQEENIFW